MIYNSYRHNINFNINHELDNDPAAKMPAVPAREYHVPWLYSYDRNIYGFRSKDFHSRTKLITIGCSHGFGIGLPVEYTWPSQAAKLLDIEDHVNLSLSGCSIFTQVRILANYINKYGSPGLVLANFPDYPRYEYALKDGKITDGNSIAKLAGSHDVSQNKGYASWLALTAINFLEALCASNRVKLRWQFWCNSNQFFLDEKGDAVLGISESSFKNYVDLKSSIVPGYKNNPVENWIFPQISEWSFNKETGQVECSNPNSIPTCCEELRSDTEDFFHFAYDRFRVPHWLMNKELTEKEFYEIAPKTVVSNIADSTHHGAHWNWHWAQSLVQSLGIEKEYGS